MSATREFRSLGGSRRFSLAVRLGAAVLVPLVVASPAWPQDGPSSARGQGRAPAEQERAQAEQERAQAEQERAQAEQERAQAEGDEQERRARAFRARDRVMVVGDPLNLDIIPGSVHLLRGRALSGSQTAFDDIHRILRRIPGVNIQEEEGFGLRPNIGLRGSGTERSSRITLMEDGVLIAPAPYAAPAAYFFPTAGRMTAIEVRKGSSQVKYGPRTNGGALNLVTRSVPDAVLAQGGLGVGQHGTAKGRLAVGGSIGRFGLLAETYQIATDGYKRLDGGGDSGFGLHDYMVKLRYRTDAVASTYHDLEIKLGVTRQNSDETYVGLTDADFAIDPLRRYAGSQHDRLESRQRQVQVRHFTALGDGIDVTTIAYRNDFRRDWYKLQAVNGTSLPAVFGDPVRFADELAILRGADSAADALTQRHNDREYYAHGVQSIVGFRAGDRVRHQVEIGARWHVDEEDRFQSEDGFTMLAGNKVLTALGPPGGQANRVNHASALALFAQDRIQIGRLGVTPGARFERIRLSRADYALGDSARRAPTRLREAAVDVVVPGIGLDYTFGDFASGFLGVHRGFAPPGPGASNFAEAETSVAYEAGLRFRRRAIRAEVVGFYTDYANLLGTDTLASGGTGTGEQFNGGAVTVSGLEISSSVDVGALAGWSLAAPIAVSYTHTTGSFENGFESDFDPWGRVEPGDELPYLARHQLFVSTGIDAGGWSATADLSYTGRMRTVAGSGPIAVAESTDPHAVVNLGTEVSFGRGVALLASVQNLLDTRYIVARRPAGARPGLPRTLFTEIRLSY